MKTLNKYATLIVRTGINIQKDQILIIRSQIVTAAFARECMRIAYEAGAKDVHIHWIDDKTDRLRFQHSDKEALQQVEPWLNDYYNTFAEKDAAFLIISANNPDKFEGVNSEIIAAYNTNHSKAMATYYEKLLNNRIAWCIAAMPTIEWAKKVYPALSDDDAIDKLLDAILVATRANEDDPVAAWQLHQEKINQWLGYLNTHNFKRLTYKNNLGTNFHIDLAPNHIWFGGADVHTEKGYNFIANLPTEEVYTAPHMASATGRVIGTRPLEFSGQLIEDFWFEFKDGVVVDYGARVNKDVLTQIFTADNDARKLGEVALVPYNSPISNQKVMFYNTLFDENASCHLALGQAYPICIKGGENMSPAQRLENHINIANIHIDFMIGSADLMIDGQKEDGQIMPIFRNGNFTF